MPGMFQKYQQGQCEMREGGSGDEWSFILNEM